MILKEEDKNRTRFVKAQRMKEKNGKMLPKIGQFLKLAWMVEL